MKFQVETHYKALGMYNVNGGSVHQLIKIKNSPFYPYSNNMNNLCDTTIKAFLLVAGADQISGNLLLPRGQKARQGEGGLSDQSVLGQISHTHAIMVVVYFDDHLKPIVKINNQK